MSGDRYRLGPAIGRGGMGEVIAAHDADIGRDVAIKRLHAPNPTPLELTRFLREARIQGRLDHPAIVPVHELGYDELGRPYFAMKKLSGTTLAVAIQDRRPRRQLLGAFVDVCLAIEFAHTRGVIHRDLKPANILLGEFGEVYVLDWGIARIATDRDTVERDTCSPAAEGATGVATRAGATIGTCGYMAPEQVRGERGLDTRIDVYALGCVLFEILAGTPLHPGGDAGLRSALVGIDARPSLRSGEHDLAPELDDLCVRATWIDREQRIGSARELAHAVQHYLDGDQNLALRARLALEHLAIARAALSASNDEESNRKSAMHEAGRALALDPTLLGAAQLVGHLMIEPPRTTPTPVVAELAEIDRADTRGLARTGACMHALYIVTAAVFWAVGVHDALYVGAMAALGLFGIVTGVLGMRGSGERMAIAQMLGFVLMIGLLARMFTPFLVAPGVMAVDLMAFAFHPAGARLRVFGAAILAGIGVVLGTVALELCGALSQTMWFDGDMIVLHSPVDGIEHMPTLPALIIFALTLIGSTAAAAFFMARAIRTARRRLHVQAWQLRQLVAPDR